MNRIQNESAEAQSMLYSSAFIWGRMYISNGARRTPQEIRIDFAVLPAAICQGLFHHSSKKIKRF